jgi:hypothetical protein
MLLGCRTFCISLCPLPGAGTCGARGSPRGCIRCIIDIGLLSLLHVLLCGCGARLGKPEKADRGGRWARRSFPRAWAYLLGLHAVHARGLEDGVVRLARGVQDAVGQVLAAHLGAAHAHAACHATAAQGQPCPSRSNSWANQPSINQPSRAQPTANQPHQDAVQVALRAAGGDVAPVLLLINLPQPRKPVEHAHLREPTTRHQPTRGVSAWQEARARAVPAVARPSDEARVCE